MAEVASFADVLSGSDVIVCCGSGGVGKTTTAAVIGIEASRQGRRAVVVTIDPARRLADALGLDDGLGPEPSRIDLATLAGPGEPPAPGELWAMMLDTGATFDGLVRQHAGDDEQVERILGNRFYRNMAGAMSGTQEYMAAETLHALHHDDRFDLVIVDTPPSRNALDFLEAPGVLSRFLDHRVFKLAMLPTRGGLKIVGTAAQPVLKAIGRVVGSDVLSDSLAFFQSFAGMETGFRERADDVVALLRAERTSFVVVASPRRDTIGEAVWFATQLDEYGVGVAAGIVNRVQPGFGPPADPIADEADRRSAATDGMTDRVTISGSAGESDVIESLRRNAQELDDLRAAEIAALQPLLDLLAPDPVALLPLLDADVHDLPGLAQVADHLFPGDESEHGNR